MFGYVKPMNAELKIKEHELYKAVYCGLCEAMGKHICTSNRLTLSYDIVFLALVRTELCGEEIHIEKKRCLAHPAKKRNRAYIPNSLEYCARVSAILSYYNIEDNVKDTGKFKYRMLLPFAKRTLKKANLPELRGEVNDYLKQLSAAEGTELNLDTNADIFGKLLGLVFSYGLTDPSVSFAAYDMGYHCGKWIYIIDACDDFEKDKKNNTYNPLSEFDMLPREMLKTALNLELSAMQDAFCRTECKNTVLYDIIQNIITLGMPETTDKILFKENND